MTNHPKEAERQGHPFGNELAAATQREGVDAKVHSTQAFERTRGQGKSVQPLGAYTELRERDYLDLDVKAHPPGGRLLLKDAENGVRPLVASMVVRG